MDRSVPDAGLVAETPAGDLARAAAAVVCVPVSFARLLGPEGTVLEAFHGLSDSPAERPDWAAALEFAELALLQTDPLAIHDLEEAPGLPPMLRPERTRLRWLGGVPLLARDGRVTGVVCVYDRKGRSGGKAALERLAALVRGFDLTTVEGVVTAAPDPRALRAERCHEYLAGGAARELERLLRAIDEQTSRALSSAGRPRGRGRSRLTATAEEDRSWQTTREATRKARGLVVTLIELIEEKRTA